MTLFNIHGFNRLTNYLGRWCEARLKTVARPARSSLRAIKPSLGASGAVLSLFAATAVYHPEASVALIFLPMVPFTIGTGLKVDPDTISPTLSGVRY